MKLTYFLYDHTGNGGTERIISKKCNAFVAKGYEVSIINICQSAREPKFFFSEKIGFENLNLNFSRLRERNLLLKLILYPIYNQRLKRKIKAAIERQNPDILISTFNYEAKILHKIKHKAKRVLEFHHNRGYKEVDNEKRNLSPFQKKLIQYRNQSDVNIINKYDAFVLLTEDDKKAWGNPLNGMAIPNMLPFTTDLQADLTQKKALAVGRLTYLKGFDLLIDAWKTVHQNHPDWTLSIVGDGELKESLQAQINDSGLGDVITIYPFTSDVISHYISHSFYICSSRQEGFGLTLIEAMECGLPCISFDCSSGPAEIITDQIDGFLVKKESIIELSAKMVEMIENSTLRHTLGKNAKINAKRYSEERIIEKWTTLFESFF